MYWETKSVRSEDNPRVKIGCITEHVLDGRVKILLNFKTKIKEENIDFSAQFDKKQLLSLFKKDIAHLKDKNERIT